VKVISLPKRLLNTAAAAVHFLTHNVDVVPLNAFNFCFSARSRFVIYFLFENKQRKHHGNMSIEECVMKYKLRLNE
jgi:hypothetical protein